MATIKRKPSKLLSTQEVNVLAKHKSTMYDLNKQYESVLRQKSERDLQQQIFQNTPEYKKQLEEQQRQLKAEKRQEEWMKENQKTADERRRYEMSLASAKRKKELDAEKYLENKQADAMVKRQVELDKQQAYKDIFKRYEPVQTKESETAFGRIGQKFTKGYKDITGISQTETRKREAETARLLQQQIAAEKGQMPDYLSQAEKDAQLQAQGGRIKTGWTLPSVVAPSGLSQMGQTMASNLGFQGKPSYDVQNLNSQAGAYLGTSVFNVANPSLPSYAQQAEKARVLTSTSSTGAAYRSPLDVVRDATGAVMTTQQSPSDKIKQMTSQGQTPQGMYPEMYDEMKIARLTGVQRNYQEQFQVGQPMNPMGVQFQQQPYIQQRTIDPYQQQMMQEMRAQAQAQRQQQRSVEDQIVRQKVASMNNIGPGVNVGMAGGVNLNKNYNQMGQSQDYVPSPREVGVTTPASRPVTYRRGAYQKHQ